MLPWWLWPGKGWPATETDEIRFRDELGELASTEPKRPAPRWSRPGVVVVMTALRGGARPSAVVPALPAMTASTLERSYAHLQRLLHAAFDDWEAMLSSDAGIAYESVARASALMPVPAGRLLRADQQGETALREERLVVLERINALRERVDAITAELDSLTPPSMRGVQLGRVLFDANDTALWREAYFLPRRVGELSSMRIAGLLGERKDDPNPL